MKKQITLLVLFILAVPEMLSPQVSQIINDSPRRVTQKWVARYNGPGNGIDQAKIIATDASGNVYVAGQSTGSGSGLDFVTVKYNSAGVQQWLQRYNGTANNTDYIGAMVMDASANVYITGGSRGTGTAADAVTIKYNSDGVQQWIHRFNGTNSGNDMPFSIVLDASGNVYVAGQTVETYEDFMTLKYNSSGVLQWARMYNGEFFGNDNGDAVTVDADGNVYTTGHVEGFTGGFNIVTVKYNSAGDEQWVREYSGTVGLADWPVEILTDGSGNIIMGGFACETTTDYDYLTVKYNSSGDQQWLKRFNGPLNARDYASSMVFDLLGNVIITGDANNFGISGLPDYGTVKYNSSGVQQWSSTYNGPATGYDAALDVTTDVSGNVYVTGESAGSGSQSDYATIKYDLSGGQQFVQRYNGPGNSVDIARSIAVDNFGSIYVTGESTGSGTGLDFATIKYSNSLAPSLSGSPSQYKLLENYPNPFNPTTIISYQLPVSGIVSLKIYDILGNEIATLVKKNQSAGSHSVEWNAGNFSSGIYFYKLVTHGFTETRKMNLIK